MSKTEYPFSIEQVMDDQVIVKMDELDALGVAQHPYVSSDWAYITVTRGKEKVLTVVSRDGLRPLSFCWGGRTYDVLSGNTERLKKTIERYLSAQRIFMGVQAPDTEQPVSCIICFSSYRKAWTAGFKFTGEDREHIAMLEADELENAIAEAREYWPQMPEPERQGSTRAFAEL